MKARKPSTLETITSPRSVATAAASSGTPSPSTTLGSFVAPSRSSARVSVDSPTLAAQPPQTMSALPITGMRANSGAGAPSSASTWKRRTKRRSIQSFKPKHPLALEGHAPLAADGAAVAQVEEGEEVALRMVGLERMPHEPRAEVLHEDGPLAHGVDAGLRQIGGALEARAVAHREDVVVLDELQRAPHAHEAARVRRHPGALEDVEARRPRHPRPPRRRAASRRRPAAPRPRSPTPPARPGGSRCRGGGHFPPRGARCPRDSRAARGRRSRAA